MPYGIQSTPCMATPGSAFDLHPNGALSYVLRFYAYTRHVRRMKCTE